LKALQKNGQKNMHMNNEILIDTSVIIYKIKNYNNKM
jgi:hypothetical protein